MVQRSVRSRHAHQGRRPVGNASTSTPSRSNQVTAEPPEGVSSRARPPRAPRRRSPRRGDRRDGEDGCRAPASCHVASTRATVGRGSRRKHGERLVEAATGGPASRTRRFLPLRLEETGHPPRAVSHVQRPSRVRCPRHAQALRSHARHHPSRHRASRCASSPRRGLQLLACRRAAS